MYVLKNGIHIVMMPLLPKHSTRTLIRLLSLEHARLPVLRVMPL